MDAGDATEFLERIEAMVDAGAWRYEPRQERLILSPGAARIFDRPAAADELTEPPQAFVHEEDRSVIADAVAACRDHGEPFERTVRIVTGTERTRWCRLSGERVDGADAPYLRGAIVDVTNERRDNQRLTVLNRVIRHNIANDVTVIQAHADLLADDVGASTEDFFRDQADSEHHEHVRTIAETARELAETSEKARTIERVLADTPSRRRIELEELVASVAESIDAAYPEVEVRYDVPAEPMRTDPDRLRLVLEELVENAIAHHDEADPTIEIASEAEPAGGVRLAVIDDGPGIPSFERTVLTNAEETPLQHGSGIGLWMVHWFVEQLGGRITIEDLEPHGTRVELVLPPSPHLEDLE